MKQIFLMKMSKLKKKGCSNIKNKNNLKTLELFNLNQKIYFKLDL